MKKYLKLQAKKSMSLFLAVIMLLSCWVWVAPTQAEAVDQHDGYYKVRMVGYVQDTMDDTSAEWKLTLQDGTTHTLSGAKDLSNTIGSSGSPAALTNEDWVQSFPTSVSLSIVVSCGDRDKGRIEDNYLQVYDFANSKWVNLHDVQVYNCEKNSTTSFTFSTKSDLYPVIKTIKNKTNTLEQKSMSATVPVIGNNGTVSTSFTAAGAYDQYDVRVKAAEYSIAADNTGSASLSKEDGIWLDGTTVYANADIQVNHANKTGTQKAFIIASADGLTGTIAEITLKYPNYTVKVDQDGSISGLGATINLSGGTSKNTAWTGTGAYSSILDPLPTGGQDDNGNFLGASKEGFTFMGFWTTQQPTSGAAGTNASADNFAKPVDTATFDKHKATEDATLSENNLVVTLADGSKYYNAGTQWDSTVHKEVTGNKTFYGWWIPRDIVVKFYDIDGAYLGSKNAKYGDTPNENWYLNPKDESGYNAGAMTYKTFAKKWRDANTGYIITEGSYTFGAHAELILTPIYETKTYTDKYLINFVDPTDGTGIVIKNDKDEIVGGTKEYDYRYILNNDNGNENIPTSVTKPNALNSDPAYTYVFDGWTTQAPTGGKHYVTAPAGDTSIKANEDWVVRGETTYYPLFRSTVKEYVVAFKYTDSTGADKTETLYVPYGSVISTPDVVNRTYATGGFGYTLEGWTSDDYQNGAVLTADGTLVFNNTNVFVTTNNLAPGGSAIVFTADYGDGQPTPYTVTFKYKDANGIAQTEIAEVYHGEKITADDVAKLDRVPAQYDDGDALYKFSGMWKVTEGTADKAEYTKDEFTSFGPTSHVTFEAVYGEGTPYYTVTYIDGTNTYSERLLKGENIPAWIVGEGEDAKEYVPAKEDTATGSYTFEGWFDAQQADKDFGVTNGTKYTTADIVTGDITLYSQFTFSPFKFTVKFVNYDGTVLAEGEYEAGESFKAIYDEAEAKALKPADDTYSYTFVGWDNNPGNYLCPNGDITFKAEYRPAYIYYTVRWYNDLASMNGADPEMDFVGQNGLLAITNHTYESSVYAPSVKFNLPAAPEGKVALFAGWKYLVNGDATDYVRGMQITDGMRFYATYKFEDEAAKTYTVTTVVAGQANETYTIVEGDTAANIPNPANGYVDTAYHRNFVAWYTDAEYTTAFDLNTVITENITIYAKFEQEEHSKTMAEFVSAPTYYAMGTEYLWCACDKEATIIRDDEGKPAPQETIPMLTDTVAPVGTIYLGTQGSWTSTETDPAKTGAGDTNVYYANADTDIVLTINDAGDVGPYNTNGVGKGIATIQGIISTGEFGADTTEIAGIQTILSDNSEAQNNTANYVIRLGTYEGLVDGTEYIAYYYAKDKAGNVLNKNVRSAKFIYDTTAPEIEISGDVNAQTATETYAEYCGKATIKGIENGATLTINGEAVALTSSGANGKSNHTVNEAGNYLIKVTDKAGNTTTKKIKVTDGHNEVTTSQDVTCTADGYVKVTCAACGKVISNVETKSEGHKYGTAVTVAPTCTDKGYDVATCSVCGDEQKTNEVAATGHKHEGWTVITAATCKTAGKKISNCSVCGKDTLTETIAIDENAHVYGAKKVLKATCTEAGEVYQNCKYCFEKNLVETLEPLNHVDTGRYTKVTTAPTCTAEGVETTYCKACDEVMGTAAVAKIAHTLVLVKHTDENYMQYECQVCDYTEGRTDIAVKAEYTVTFKDADGNEITKITKTEGESIAADAVADLEKAEDNEYKYTFAGWKNSSGKVVKLPVKVTKNETYTPEFTATKRIYTHTFKLAEDDDAAFATIIGTYGQEGKKPAGIPTKASDGKVNWKFNGWIRVDEKPEDPFKMTGDATFVADFVDTPIEYTAIFYGESLGDYIHSVGFDADGTFAYNLTDENGDLKVPTKKFDDEKHYKFYRWTYGEKEYQLGETIRGAASDMRILAKFTGEAHDLKVVEDANKTWDATCIKAGQKTEVCSCGYEKVTTLPTIEHNYELQTGDIKKCTMCGDEIAPDLKEVTITFIYGAEGEFSKSYKVVEGKEKSFTVPEVADTAEKDYTFAYWADASGNAVKSDATITVTAGTDNAEYKAVYTSETRKYNVTYVNWDYTTLQTSTELVYGSAIPAYIESTPTRKHVKENHYVFAGWTIDGVAVASDAKVEGTTVIMAKFDAEDHEYKDEVFTTAASCTKPATKYKECEVCNYQYILNTSGSLEPHKPNADGYFDVVEAGINKPGSKSFICATCDGKFTEKTPAIPGDKIVVIVYNDSGKLATNGSATITLYEIVDGESVLAKGPVDTDGSGSVTFEVLKNKKWRVTITGDDMEGGNGGEVKAGTNIFGEPAEDVKPENPEDAGCKCSCHKDTFWGIIYRFFQKLVMWLTGNPKCCSDPDSRIWD